VMLHGAVEGLDVIDGSAVETVIADLGTDMPAHVAAAPADARPEAHYAERLAMIEARLAEQDAALRRVLALLVDWVESDVARPEPAAPLGERAA